MAINPKPRRVELLWQALQQIKPNYEQPFEIGYEAAKAASLVERYGDADYYKVLEQDIRWLENTDKAIEEVVNERAANLPGYTPSYRLTFEGRQMLFDAGKPIDPMR